MSQFQNAFEFKTFDTEMFFARRLKEHGKRCFEGITWPEVTKERIRAAIIESRVDCVIIGRAPNGKPETYAQSFERFYGEPLIPTTRKGKRTC
jgi:hypothetical protein